MADWRKWLTAGFVLAACTAASASTAPADPCSLLSASAVGTAMGVAYSAPTKSVAPRPFANTVEGTDCRYKSSAGGNVLLFRIYFDASAAQATELHARLKMFYGPGTEVPGVGDEAYFDDGHGLHVRKGNVRFFLSQGDNEKPLTALAKVVAGAL
jgi:hypothetical protein